MSRRMTLAAQDMVHGVFAAKEARLSQHVPYAAFLDPTTISTRNGDLMRVFEVDGFACPCGGRLVLHAVVRPPATFDVLASLERSAHRRARAPPIAS